MADRTYLSSAGAQAYATVVADENPTTADLFTAAAPDPAEADSQFEEMAIPATASTAAFVSGGERSAGGDDSDDDDIIIVEPETEPKRTTKREGGDVKPKTGETDAPYVVSASSRSTSAAPT